MVEPGETKSKQDKIEPDRDCPKTNMEEPIHAKLWRGRGNPRCKESSTNMKKSERAKLLIDNDNAKCTLSRTNKMESVLATPKTKRGKPR